MGFFENLFKPKAVAEPEPPLPEKRSNPYIAGQMIHIGPATGNSPTGLVATPENALKYSAVYAAVRILAESIAMLPLHLYEHMDKGKRTAREHPLYDLLHDAPNDLQTSFEFREFMMKNLLLWGNAYAEIFADGAGRVLSLWPLRASNMQQITIDENRRRWYYYQEPATETSPGYTRWLPGWKIWHIRGLGEDGLTGYSPIRVARHSIELGMAAEEFGARLFGNDARPGGVLEHPGALSDEAYSRLMESWDDRHLGLSKSHRPAILEEGMKWSQVTIPPEDAQFLQTRTYQVQDIARLFRIPPHMLAELSHATFTNIEHQSLDFVNHSLAPWMVRIEQSIRQNLLTGRDKQRFYAKFNTGALVRGDIESRYNAYATGRTHGFLSADDIRELEDMNPLPDGQGEIYLNPMNMVPAGTFQEPAAPEPAPPEPPQPEPPAVIAVQEERSIEQRQITSAQQKAIAARQKLITRYEPLFVQTMTRLIRREIADIRRAATKFNKQNDAAGFIRWLEEFYKEHAGFIAENLRPLIKTYGEAILDLVRQELESGEEKSPDNFIDAYPDTYGERYTNKNYELLITDFNAAEEKGEPWFKAINDRLDVMELTRPEAEARQENHRANNAIALAGYMLLGALFKTWHTVGETCEFCAPLDGMTVAIEEPFVSAGATLRGKEGTLTVKTKRDHPALHWGCDCMMTAKR